MSPVARYIRYTFLHIVFRATQTVLISKNAVLWDVKDVSYWTFWRIVFHEYNFRLQMFVPR
jgi:hypothetical protein